MLSAKHTVCKAFAHREALSSMKGLGTLLNFKSLDTSHGPDGPDVVLPKSQQSGLASAHLYVCVCACALLAVSGITGTMIL